MGSAARPGRPDGLRARSRSRRRRGRWRPRPRPCAGTARCAAPNRTRPRSPSVRLSNGKRTDEAVAAEAVGGRADPVQHGEAPPERLLVAVVAAGLDPGQHEDRRVVVRTVGHGQHLGHGQRSRGAEPAQAGGLGGEDARRRAGPGLGVDGAPVGQLEPPALTDVATTDRVGRADRDPQRPPRRLSRRSSRSAPGRSSASWAPGGRGESRAARRPGPFVRLPRSSGPLLGHHPLDEIGQQPAAGGLDQIEHGGEVGIGAVVRVRDVRRRARRHPGRTIAAAARGRGRRARQPAAARRGGCRGPSRARGPTRRARPGRAGDHGARSARRGGGPRRWCADPAGRRRGSAPCRRCRPRSRRTGQPRRRAAP